MLLLGLFVKLLIVNYSQFFVFDAQQILFHCNFVDDLFKNYVKFAVFSVVGGTDVVGTFLLDEFDAVVAGTHRAGWSGHGVGVIDSNGGATVEVDHLHGRHVGLSVSNVDEVGEGHGAFVFWY